MKKSINSAKAAKAKTEPQIQHYKPEISSPQRTLKDTTDETSLLLDQLQQLQEFLEQEQLKRSALQKKVATLESELINFHSTDKETGFKNEIATQQILSEQVQINDLRSKLKAVEQDKTMLLIDLMQIQVELEHHAIKNKDLDENLKCYKRIAKHLLRSYPDHIGFDDLRIEQDSVIGPPSTRWYFEELHFGVYYLPKLDFTLSLHNGVAGIAFSRDENIDSPLFRWPHTPKNKGPLLCLPEAGHALQGHNSTLSSLSTRDWHMLRTLVSCLKQLLATSTTIQLPNPSNASALHAALTELDKILAQWPPVLRHDHLILQVDNRGAYQGISFELHNVQLGDKLWPTLHYKLSTVDGPNEALGKHPRLEFPESTKHVFNNWFVESNDSSGARLELRFARPDALDTDVWHRIDSEDKVIVAGILSALPSQLEELQRSQVDLNVPWQTWQEIACSMKSILSQHVRKRNM